MNFSVTILGNNSALPAHNRHPTSQLVSLHNHSLLVDCGEGTQMQINAFKIKRSRIHHIFISHLHGDHYFGLPGLVTSYQLMQRKDPLHIYAPAGLKKIIDTILNESNTILNFELKIHELNFENSKQLLETDSFTVHSFPVKHRIPTCGFKFCEKPGLRKIKQAMIAEHNIPIEKIISIKKGDDFVSENGVIIQNEILTQAPGLPKQYSFCADTIYDETILEHIKGSSLLYHESTFMHELSERASKTFHSTTTQAATIAKNAGVEKLLLGHFSAKYADLNPLLIEAQNIFPNTMLAIEGETFAV